MSKQHTKGKDVMKLMMNGEYQVQLTEEHCTSEFEVLFQGPKESSNEGGR